MRWLAAWVVASVLAFLVVASRDGAAGTLAAPGLGSGGSSGVAFVLGVQLLVAVAVAIVVLGRRARRHGL